MDKVKNHIEYYTPRDIIPKTSAYAMPGIRGRPIGFSIQIACKILEHLADRYEVSVEKLLSMRRDQPLVYIRQLYVYWMRKKYSKEASYVTLGKILGKRNHTTMMYSEEVFQKRLNTDDKLRKAEQVHSKTIREDYLKTSKFLQSCLMEIRVDS